MDLGTLLLLGGVTEGQLTEIFTIFETVLDQLKQMKAVLNHGDYLPDHVFVDDDMNITGIIDFGSFLGDAATHDFAFSLLMGPNIPLRPLLQGYGHDIEEQTEIIKAQALLLALGHLAHKIKMDLQPEAVFVQKQILRILGGGSNI
jgi:aminoglycoside phosphotransferase (APT) family kinase protein